MGRKLVLSLTLALVLVSLTLLPVIAKRESGTPAPFQATLVYAQNNRILIEGADATWEANTLASEGLVGTAKEVPARILAEYTDSILTMDLLKSDQLSQQTASVSPRILVEYADSILSINLARPTAILPVPSSPTPSPTPTPAPPPILGPGQPYVDLYGHMTRGTVGDEVILYLSVINPITSPGTLVVQLTLRIPSGWSITSSGFGQGEGGLRTNEYKIQQGPNPQAIYVHILANQPFEGNIIGYMDYYFEGEEPKYRNEVTLTVEAKPAQPIPEPALPPTAQRAGRPSPPPPFIWIILGIGAVVVIALIVRTRRAV